MSLTVNAKSYTNDNSRGNDIYRYLGPNHDSDTNDMIDLYRYTAPQGEVGSVKSKARFKLTRSVTDGTDQLSTDAIVDVVFSVPTGTVLAEVQALMDDLGAWLGTTAADDLVVSHRINQ